MRGYSLTCDHCGHTKTTWGPWPFAFDKHGKRIRISSRGRGPRRVQGHESRQYCRDCRKTRLVITPHPLTGKPYCPKCGGERLAFSIADDEEVLCPKCERGYLKVSKRWIT